MFSKYISYLDYSSHILQHHFNGQHKIISFFNCHIFRDGHFSSIQDNPELWVRDGRIIEQQRTFYKEKRRPDLYVDCRGLILVPGFIDVQVNGAFGVDFTTLTESECNKTDAETEDIIDGRLRMVARRLLEYGVTGFCPAIITSKPFAYKNLLKILKNWENSSDDLSCILGAHFEGPFISPDKCGCHPRALIISQSDISDNITSVYGEDFSNLSIVTLAPELEGAIEAIVKLKEKGIKVSVGHSAANSSQIKSALDAGATCITHIFNAMTTFNHREPAFIGLLTDADRPCYYTIICDGIHLADEVILLAYNSRPNGIILVTDCTSAFGLGDGVYKLGAQTIRVDGRRATLEGTRKLAGSVSSMPDCLKNFSDCLAKQQRDEDELACIGNALRAVTSHPADFLGIAHRKGTLAVGSDADFVLIDSHFCVHATFVAAIKCYQRDAA